MSHGHMIWSAISVATVALQLMLETSAVFSAATLSDFLLMPPGYALLRNSESVGFSLLIATLGKLFVVSQWLKIVFGQAADTNLQEPSETVIACFCKCGHLDDAAIACGRAPRCAQNYQSKISGPLFDRIDLHVDVPAVSPVDLSLPPPAEGSAEIAARVARARAVQLIPLYRTNNSASPRRHQPLAPQTWTARRDICTIKRQNYKNEILLSIYGCENQR